MPLLSPTQIANCEPFSLKPRVLWFLRGILVIAYDGQVFSLTAHCGQAAPSEGWSFSVHTAYNDAPRKTG